MWARVAPRWLDEKLGIPSVTAAVARRAVRNCYWSGPLWAAALRAADRAGEPAAALGALRDAALAAGLQVRVSSLPPPRTPCPPDLPLPSLRDAAALPA